MQRLFTTFAGGWPGFGLLVQRLMVGIILIQSGLRFLEGAGGAATIAPQSICALLSIFLVTGLWTPAAGVLIAAVEAWELIHHNSDANAAIMIGTLSVTLAMIGPGAYSIDAVLFGRKQIGG